MDLKRKVVSLLLAMIMVVTFMPALAFADDGNDGASEPVIVEEALSDNDTVNEEKQEAEAIEDAEAYQLLNASGEDEPALVAELEQTMINYRNVTVKVEDLNGILESKTADSIKIDASMSYDGQVTLKESKTLKLADFDTSEKSAVFELPYYGKYNVSMSFLKDGKQVGERKESVLGIAAEEYNIAPLVATTDTLMFSLKYFIDGAIKKTTDSGDPVPTIITLNRAKQLDWNNLPDGIFRAPLLSAEENVSTMKWGTDQNADDSKLRRLEQYVRELNEIHAGSKFNFYINDYHVYCFPRLSFANGLEDDQYTLTMITDGSATYVYFKAAYEGTDDAQSVHDRLVQEYLEIKEKAKAGENIDFNNLPSGLIRLYNYAIVDAEDAQWWVIRKSATDTFSLTDTAFQAKVIADSRISNNYINNLLSTIDGNGSTDAFKTLYKFDDEAFSATRAKGKKIIMIIGTSKSLEDSYPVTDYVRFMVAEMGDEYEFYYKGHPGNYTANSAENTAKYKAMGIQMLEPSIAAELFLFFNDDIYLCGYESSLYTNASSEKSEQQDIALFRRTMQTAKADPTLAVYADCMDFFISDITDDTDKNTYAYDEAWDADRPGMTDAKAESIAIRDKIKAIIPKAEANDGNFLVQYNNTESKTVSEYDYAIWNSDRALIHYVKADKKGNLSIVLTKSAGGITVGKTVKSNGNSYKVTSVRNKTVTFTKAKNKKTVTVPATVTIKGEKYAVTAVAAKAFTAKKIRTVNVGSNVKKIAKNAFKGSKATKVIVKSKLLTKKRVKGSLKNSKIKKVKVKLGSKKINKQYITKYKKIFTLKNAGRKVKVY